jgi:hypothetical protein
MMQGTTADKREKQNAHIVQIAAGPKLGKTDFATSAPSPLIVIACDLGEVTIYPGAKKEEILILDYQAVTRMINPGGSNPTRDVYSRLMKDLQEVYVAAKAHTPLKLEDGSEFPAPKTIVLDGFSRLNTMLVDGRLAMNNLSYTDDLPKNIRFNFWGKRGTDVYAIIQQYASLDVNVVITSWIKAEVKNNAEGQSYDTGILLPDIGGAMDRKTPGTVASSIMCVSRGGKYYIRTKPDATTPWLGVRNRFDLPYEVEVTHDAHPSGLTPWEKIFGGIKK